MNLCILKDGPVIFLNFCKDGNLESPCLNLCDKDRPLREASNNSGQWDKENKELNKENEALKKQLNNTPAAVEGRAASSHVHNAAEAPAAHVSDGPWL